MKLGFACKYLNHDGKQFFPFRATTRKRFLSLPHDQRNQLIYEISVTNLNQLYLTLEQLATLPEPLRMMRIGSDLLPLYTVPEATSLFAAFLPELHPLFARCGELARAHQIRLSFHPGQYTVLASDNPDVVSRALEDVEYHTLCACLMGYGQRFQDFKINIHMNGKAGFDGFKRSFGQLSEEARRMLTVENDEISCSLDDVLQAAALCPVVLDIHHHWVKENQFIQPDDARIAAIIASWRGVRPVLHYSISQEGIIPPQGWPDQQQLGVSKSKLRAHSDYYFNDTLNDWALSFQDFDIMCEVKMKNLAREQLYQWAKQQQRIA
ncbi:MULTISPECIES: UV damage endonuclease UvsE [Pantoea]|jgi:UV DNA damage endonuclease|uniref:UV damage endonuclease UvsE n=1 Tax=Pantoea brenneri TaxID=472694 RepID=A0A7Y6NAW3_9GAMM|nr:MULTISPECIES: UV damage endonuclease UvsE [Pantoea]KKD33443.1 UV damage repair endonuclease UvdE [Pantoea sp. 3.5.1]MBZ6393473.1 UV damage endonuclease UvsE [Pantoea sp.]MBZ6437544.1 UV damage endonuclease UvsE [Pantoea sp.]MCQ5472878.1 UV damage endonuclease UvsE [Pantoea brenneri]MDU4126243.1 UV damage endonuclease UvsE [Pantoea sp.]